MNDFINKIINYFYKIKNRLANIKYWWKIILNDYDWDSCFLYIVEREKLNKMLKYFKNIDSLSKKDKNHIISRISLAIKLLDIILQDDPEYNQYLDKNFGQDVTLTIIDPYTHKYVGINYTDDDAYIPVYVNIKNITKYNKYTQFNKTWINNLIKKKKSYLFLMDIRREKAISLYYKLRQLYTDTWWD